MTEIPETWPPRPSATLGGPVVPLFPLPGVFLYPHQLMPLHVFEPRYLEMMRHILDSHGQLIVGTVLESHKHRLLEDNPPPEVLSVAGFGEIARYDKTKDGRYLIWVLGRERVTIDEAPSTHAYRQARYTPLPESEVDPHHTEGLSGNIREAILMRHKTLDKLPDELPIGVLVDLLAQQLDVPQSILERLFSEPDVERRADIALAAHAHTPI